MMHNMPGATDDIDSKMNMMFGVVQGNRSNPYGATAATTTTVAKRFQVCCLHYYKQVATGFVFVGKHAINSNVARLDDFVWQANFVVVPLILVLVGFVLWVRCWLASWLLS